MIYAPNSRIIIVIDVHELHLMYGWPTLCQPHKSVDEVIIAEVVGDRLWNKKRQVQKMEYIEELKNVYKLVEWVHHFIP